MQKDKRVYWSGHREGVSAAVGRLLHKFGVDKEGTAEREVLIQGSHLSPPPLSQLCTFPSWWVTVRGDTGH